MIASLYTLSNLVTLGDRVARRVYLEERLKELPMSAKRHNELTRRLVKALGYEREAIAMIRRACTEE